MVGLRFRLDGGGDTLVFSTVASAPPALVYWGPSLPKSADLDSVAALAQRPVPHGMLDCGEVLDLAPDAGRGFCGTPLALLHRSGALVISQFQIVTMTASQTRALIVLEDAAAGVRLELEIEIDANCGVVAFRNRLTNLGQAELYLDGLAAGCLPLDHDELLAFEGRWANEGRAYRQRVIGGMWASENRTGRTSHHAPPFLVVGEPGFTDQSGTVLGLHLAWSGNHRLLVERLRDGRLQVQAAELFLPGEVVLATGAHYQTPTLYAARSDTGLNGLSDRFHPFVRQTILCGRLAGRPRPVHFNTWEAIYFDHEPSVLAELIAAAAAVGAERFVLDDGWFRGRNDDRTSLGDWTADPVKYPDGLLPLIDKVHTAGMGFGLWVEPEMANADSELLRAHPDWVLGVSDRVQPLGRGQYVLDLTRPEVRSTIFEQLDRLLTQNPIDYLKWDMNRDLTHPVSGGHAAVHRQTLAVYGLIDDLRARHPGVEIESCASGGGRADFEILRRTDRIWTSDCNDPVERQAIQRSFSLFFPPEVMGAHIGPRASHTTARETAMEFRAWTALFGHLGIEADLRSMTFDERQTLTNLIGVYKQYRALLHGGRSLRLSHADTGMTAMMVTDGFSTLVSAAQVATPASAILAPLRLLGLDPLTTYRVKLLNPPREPDRTMKHVPENLSGKAFEVDGTSLMYQGLILPLLRAQEIAVYHLEALP
jgi:alpha-galactosidase